MLNKEGDNNKILQSLRLSTIIKNIKSESFVFWALCFYIFVEYLHPQTMYPVLDVLPWGWVAISTCLISVLATNTRPIAFNYLDKLFVAFSLIVIISGINAWRPEASLEEWATYLSWILMYYCVVSILNTPGRLLLFILFFILLNFKLSEYGARTFSMRGFSFAKYGLGGPPGWFRNSGEFCLEMVIMFSLCLALLVSFKEYFKNKFRWWLLLIIFPGTAVLSIVGSSSRGGQLAFVIVLLYFLLRSGQVIRKIAILCIFSFIALYFLPQEQIDRFYHAGEDRTSQLRFIHWGYAIETIEKYPYGIGYNNWMPFYKEHYDAPVYQEIHNTFLESFVDLGYQGGIVFLIMILCSFVMNVRSFNRMSELNNNEAKSLAAMALGLNMAMVGAIVASQFMSVLFYPVFWLGFALTSALRSVVRQFDKDINVHQANDISET